jgi:hypothetical protein
MEKQAKITKNISIGVKKWYETNDSPWLGKTHTEETKSKIINKSS